MLTPANMHVESSVDLASRAFCALRISVDFHQLHETPLIVIGLVLLRVANPEGGLHIDLIGSERIERVVSVTASGWGPCVLRSGSIRATHDLGEEASESETDGGHAAANDTNLALDHRPETGFEVVPCHISGVGEVNERSKSKH